MKNTIYTFSIIAALLALLFTCGTAAAAPGPAFIYPSDGQSLDYNGCWMFKVEAVPEAASNGYLWGFSQNGVGVWENYADEGTLSGTEYAICPASTAYSRFKPGLMEVAVRGLLPGEWTDQSIVSVNLALPPETLNVTKTGTGVGTVTSNPVGISCGSSCSAGFSGGISVTVIANPSFGSVFAGWSGGCTGNEKSCTVTLDASTTVTAQFVDTKKAQLPIEIPILVLAYFPDDNNDGLLDAIAGDAAGRPVSEMKPAVTQLTADLVTTLEAGSRFHGYKDAKSVNSLKYKVIDTKYFDYPIPVSTEFTPFADHLKLLNEQKICDYVKNSGVKEVWIWMYHSSAVVPIESNMAGPYGDISNSYRQADLPVCDGTYTVYDYNYGRGLSEATEDHMHQLESIFGHVDGELFSNRFVGPVGSEPGQKRCGNTHYPPNGASDYDWGNLATAISDCEEWEPDAVGLTQEFSCTKWNCDSRTYFIWWMQNIPGAGNPLYYNGNKLRNWWQFIGDFDAAMTQDKSFVYSEAIYTVNVSISGSGGGTVSVDKDALNWSGSAATGYYEKGTHLILTAKPVAGYVFTGWSGACTGTVSCSLAVDADKSVTAEFAVKKPGDCDNSGTVSIAEVQAAINMYLGIMPVSACVVSDNSNTVSIAEVQKVINGYLGL